MTDDFVSHPETTPSVELVRVSRSFGDVQAVDDLSLSIQTGEFITLLGPSGCGKTTTLRMIGGFEYPQSGTIAIHGDVMGTRPPHKRPVNTVFQNYALFPHMTVGRNIGYGLEMAGVPKKERGKRITEALELVRLPHVENRKPHELSGGQQQRVALARALINRPKVLLLDEPLGALDLKLRKAMQLELKQLNREVGITFVYVTHDQEEALTMSDRIAVMSQGRILQLGTPDEIYERPATIFVADFIGQTNLLAGEIAEVNPDFADVRLKSGARVLALRGDASSVGQETTVAVRPERVSFADSFDGGHIPNGWNLLSGTVREIVYLGTHTQYRLETTGGDHLVVHYQNRTQQHPGPAPGAMVTVGFAPADTRLLAT
ncbi:MAG: ABC transporter ATP-binding protein [Thermomicrobiales bacterium]